MYLTPETVPWFECAIPFHQLHLCWVARIFVSYSPLPSIYKTLLSRKALFDNEPHYTFKSKRQVFEELMFLVLSLTEVKQFLLRHKFWNWCKDIWGMGDLLDASEIILHRCPSPLWLTLVFTGTIGFFPSSLLELGLPSHMKKREINKKRTKATYDIEVSHRKKMIM